MTPWTGVMVTAIGAPGHVDCRPVRDPSSGPKQRSLESSGTRRMPIPATNIRKGMAIMFEGEPCRIIEFRHHTPGNLRAMVHAKMRKLKTGVTVEHRFRASDQVEEAVLETHELQYLYHDGHTYHFMNVANYEQYEMDAEALG